MKFFLLFIVFFLFINTSFSGTKPDFLSPVPNSKFNKAASSIIVRFNNQTASNFLQRSDVKIFGSKSGAHEFVSKISDDNKTIILSPKVKFTYGEIVNVTLQDFDFNFEIEKENITPDVIGIFKKENLIEENKIPHTSLPVLRSDSLPAGFPHIDITVSRTTAPGYIFFANFDFGGVGAPYQIIMDNTGNPVYYKKIPGGSYDFKKQPNGNITYYDGRALKFFEMNNSYQIIDSFYCGNGYVTDLHELRLLSNGHALLMSYDPETVNMRNVIPGGDSSAIVTGLIIQEIDANKNVVFQWRSWDHFEIIDAIHEVLTVHAIDYVHGNAIEMDTDGNIIISSRHLSEITKINRNTGAIIWRLGGVHNQFNFANDTFGFSYQHAIRRLANGNILLYDNGNYRTTLDTGIVSTIFSRAVEYRLDENSHIATQVWEFRRNPNIYGFAMGNAQRLDNGNTLISWGATNPNITEVTYSGEVVFEMSLARGMYTYRAFRDSWSSTGIQNEFSSVKNFYLYQNYPNPFNPSTTIRYNIAQKGEAELEIYNSLGKLMETINLGIKNSGSYEYNFNAASLSSGIYFYKLNSNGFSQARKMLLIK